MALDRTDITVVDDDGSETTGTALDAEFFDAIYDAIDATLHDPSVFPTTATGTQNNLALTAGTTVVRCNNATALVITGIDLASVEHGQLLLIVNVGTSTVRLAHQDTGSTADYRIIGNSLRGQIIGANGSILLVYDGTTDRWRILQVEPGSWIAVAHSAGNFAGLTSMTWTVDSGDQAAYVYRQVGATVTLNLVVQTSSVGGTPSSALLATLPNSFAAKTTIADALARLSDNGTMTTGFAQVLATGTQVRIFRTDEGNFAASTNATSVQFVLTIEVE